MKTKLVQTLVGALIFMPLLTKAQGTMVFDQQSSDEANGGSSGNVIQDSQPTGQSFTPSLSGIDFVRFNLWDINRNNGMGAEEEEGVSPAFCIFPFSALA